LDEFLPTAWLYALNEAPTAFYTNSRARTSYLWTVSDTVRGNDVCTAGFSESNGPIQPLFLFGLEARSLFYCALLRENSTCIHTLAFVVLACDLANLVPFYAFW